MKQKKVIATLTESELKRIIRNEVMRYLKEEDEVNPEDEKEVMAAFEKAAKDLNAGISKIAADVDKKNDDEEAVAAALKKQPALAKIANECIRRRRNALTEGKTRNALNEELTLLFIGSLAMALPEIVQLIGKVAKTISVLLGGSGKAGEKLIHAGHKWHSRIQGLILAGLRLFPHFKDMPADKQEKFAGIAHTAIVAILAVLSGKGAIDALSHGSTALAGIEGALTAVKAGEIGKFIATSASKLFA